MTKRRVIAVTVCVFAALLHGEVAPASAQDAPAPSDEEIVERILKLQREIDALLSRLPPETREEVRRRLAEPPPSPPAAPPQSADRDEPEPAPGPPPPPRRTRFGRRPACNTLDAFDSDGDGTVDARDRYWRYLYLWLDKNRDGKPEKREIVSTFDKKVREIAADLESFESDKAGRGDIRIEERIRLDLKGDGFDSDDDAVLMVDATALKRGSGPTLLDSAGEEVEGVQPFAPGWRLRDADGQVTRLSCP